MTSESSPRAAPMPTAVSRRGLLTLLAVAAFAAGLLGCGPESLTAPPHGLEVDSLVSAPSGDAIPLYGSLEEGVWTGRVHKQWIEIRDGGAPVDGRAVLDLRLVRKQINGVLRSDLGITVFSAEGRGDHYVRGFDGLRASVEHDAHGRPDPKTLRFEAGAPPTAASFLAGYWLAGLLGTSPWLPAGPLRVGEAWTRESIEDEANLTAALGVGQARPALHGGGRLEASDERDGNIVLDVRLDTLVDVETGRRHEALSFGVRQRGTAAFRADSGLPLTWSMEETTRLKRMVLDRLSTHDVTLRVSGELRPAPSEGAESERR